MRTSIATISNSGDLKEKLAAIASAGFDGVAIFNLTVACFDRAQRIRSMPPVSC